MDRTPSSTFSSEAPRPLRTDPRWYPPVAGLIAGVAIVLSAYLPAIAAGSALSLATLALIAAERLARSGSDRRSRRSPSLGEAIRAALVGVTLIGAIVLIWATVRPLELFWLGWVLGAVVALVVTIAGLWPEAPARPDRRR
ncbi:hypothetical protein A4X16_10740 [Microbacterium sp. H83]|nr:hypothetical protein A4X16_10740 [Microbacterium sp. H83]